MVDLLHRNCDFGLAPWQLALRLMDWTLLPVRVDGELAGVVMRRASEVHVAIEPAFRRRFWRKELREVLGATIAQHGCATTSTRAGDERARRFVERLGFEETGKDDGQIFYRIEGQRYA